MITISRLYDHYETAARVYNDLQDAGISKSDISIVANNSEGWYEHAGEPGRIDRDGDGTDDRTEGAAAGAGIGGTIGGVAGLLAGLGLMAIPGLGPVVAAGWLVSTAALAVAGGATGGIIGALTQAGVDEDDAHAYAEGVRRGGTLVTARVNDGDLARAEAIMDRNAVSIRDRARMWERHGWTRFDPNAPAYTADEIRREREMYRARV